MEQLRLAQDEQLKSRNQLIYALGLLAEIDISHDFCFC